MIRSTLPLDLEAVVHLDVRFFVRYFCRTGKKSSALYWLI